MNRKHGKLNIKINIFYMNLYIRENRTTRGYIMKMRGTTGLKKE